tara:strand:- start:179 stop:382 length:204 start_codon:yes stop_codon:yes gene_type:complete
MVYVVGIVGFIFGFVAGQMFLLFLLRDVSKEDLLNDPYIKMKYGILNWVIAISGSCSAVLVYDRYFL